MTEGLRMITGKELAADRACIVARLEGDNARLRRLAKELEAEVSEMRTSVEMSEARKEIDPAHRLLLVRNGERRSRGSGSHLAGSSGWPSDRTRRLARIKASRKRTREM